MRGKLLPQNLKTVGNYMKIQICDLGVSSFRSLDQGLGRRRDRARRRLRLEVVRR